MIFFDTSAAIALADSDDARHALAIHALRTLTNEGHTLLTHNYVLAESAAVLQRRLGMGSALSFLTDSQRFLIHWIDRGDHEEAVTLFRKRNRRSLSLVDCTSFVVMKKYNVTMAFAYDSDFRAEGFDVLG